MAFSILDFRFSIFDCFAERRGVLRMTDELNADATPDGHALATSGNRKSCPQFLYFDLGNVLLYFDHRRGARQMAEVAGVAPEWVFQVVFQSGLELEYEAGRLTSHQFYEEFCRQTQTRPDYERLARAAGAIFEVNLGAKAVLASLLAAGNRLGLLSNTNEVHWQYFADGRYGLIPEAFETLVLSFEVGTVKPDERIFQVAAERAGVAPEDIFYVDDTLGHVEAARRAGFDAVQYTTTRALVSDLLSRGVRFNY
jgi:FMN phosphatase YigB (HAD superfamily)